MADNDCENFEKIFTGIWEQHSTENLPALYTATDQSQEAVSFAMGITRVTFRRLGSEIVYTVYSKGDEAVIKTTLPGTCTPKSNLTMRLNMVGDSLHTQFEHGGTSKPYSCVFSANGDQLFMDYSFGDVKARRVLKRTGD